MINLILKCYQFALGLDRVSEHIAKRHCHGGDPFASLDAGDTVDRFQRIKKKVRVDPCFQGFHLRIERDQFVLIVGLDGSVKGFDHGVIFVIQDANLICTIQILGGWGKIFSILFGHFTA